MTDGQPPLSPSSLLQWLGKIAAWVAAHGGEPIIPFSAAFERKLVEMPDDEAKVGGGGGGGFLGAKWGPAGGGAL